MDAVVSAANDTIRAIAKEKRVVVVDFWQAFMDHTGQNPLATNGSGTNGVHPSGGCKLTEMNDPQCGYAIRNAVTGMPSTGFYRRVIDGAPAPQPTPVPSTPKSDSIQLIPIADTYLEAGIDANRSWGDKSFVRIKSVTKEFSVSFRPTRTFLDSRRWFFSGYMWRQAVPPPPTLDIRRGRRCSNRLDGENRELQ